MADEQISLEVVISLLLNVSLSSTTILVNKWLLNEYVTGISLSMTYLVFTTVGVMIFHRLKLFTAVTLPLTTALPIAMTFAGYVLFDFLCLAHFSVVTYLVLKSLPSIVYMLEKFVSGNISITSLSVLQMVLPLTGIIVCTRISGEQTISTLGVVYAAFCIICNVVNRKLVRLVEQSDDVGPLQLSYYMLPLAAAIVTMVQILMEPLHHKDYFYMYLKIFNITSSLFWELVLVSVFTLCITLARCRLLQEVSSTGLKYDVRCIKVIIVCGIWLGVLGNGRVYLSAPYIVGALSTVIGFIPAGFETVLRCKSSVSIRGLKSLLYHYEEYTTVSS